jgi:hypothetical protein
MALAGTTARRWAAAAVVVLATLLGALTAPAAAPLYAQDVYNPPPPPGPGQGGAAPYPGRNTRVVTDPAALEQALTRASLHTGFAPERLVENEPTVFTATVTYGREPDAGRTVEVAYSNNARLRALDAEQFDIVPKTGERQNLDDGKPDGKGGLALAWSWDVTPRAAGPLTLELVIEPVVIMWGEAVKDLAPRNEPITIDVLVHPNRPPFEALVAASGTDLELKAPEKLRAEEEATVTVDFPLHGHGQIVSVALSMAEGQGSVPVVVEQRANTVVPDEDVVHGEWVITPGKDGVANLAVAATISTKVGDRTLEEVVEVPVTRVVEAQRSFLTPFMAVVGGATGILTLLVTLAAVKKEYRTTLTRLWNRFGRRPDEAEPSGPPPPGPS